MWVRLSRWHRGGRVMGRWYVALRRGWAGEGRMVGGLASRFGGQGDAVPAPHQKATGLLRRVDGVGRDWVGSGGIGRVGVGSREVVVRAEVGGEGGAEQSRRQSRWWEGWTRRGQVLGHAGQCGVGAGQQSRRRSPWLSRDAGEAGRVWGRCESGARGGRVLGGRVCVERGRWQRARRAPSRPC